MNEFRDPNNMDPMDSPLGGMTILIIVIGLVLMAGLMLFFITEGR